MHILIPRSNHSLGQSVRVLQDTPCFRRSRCQDQQEDYQDKILRDTLLPWSRSHFGNSSWTFQQDAFQQNRADVVQESESRLQPRRISDRLLTRYRSVELSLMGHLVEESLRYFPPKSEVDPAVPALAVGKDVHPLPASVHRRIPLPSQGCHQNTRRKNRLLFSSSCSQIFNHCLIKFLATFDYF